MPPSPQAESSARQTDSYDRRYLAFSGRTAEVFARHPQLELLRHSIFRDSVEGGRPPAGAGNWLKHWLRPWLRRGRTARIEGRYDVLLWMDGVREGPQILRPVRDELQKLGCRTGLVHLCGKAALVEGAVEFQFPARSWFPRWARQAWDELEEAIPTLRQRNLRLGFGQAAANLESCLDEVRRVLDMTQPRCVASSSMQQVAGAAAVVASRGSGIETALLQHGSLQPLYTPVVANQMLTWGASSRDTMLRLGIPSERVMASGSPKHDRVGLRGGPDGLERLSRALNLPPRPTFVFFSNGNDLLRNGDAPEVCASWLRQLAAHTRERLNVVVRLHPNEDGALYRDCPDVHLCKREPPLELMLDGCTWVASLCSTAMHEALLFGKEVWHFDAPDFPELADNWQQGLAVRIDSVDVLLSRAEAKLKVAASTSAEWAGKREYVFANHPHAAASVAQRLIRPAGDRAVPEARRSAAGG